MTATAGHCFEMKSYNEEKKSEILEIDLIFCMD
jgi:hypothetical protein